MEELSSFPIDNPDVAREILLKLDLESLDNVCATNTDFNKLCDNWFWRQKFEQDYPDLGTDVDYKQIYHDLQRLDTDAQLVYVAKHGYTMLVAYFLKGYESSVAEALQKAIVYGNAPIVKMLMDYTLISDEDDELMYEFDDDVTEVLTKYLNNAIDDNEYLITKYIFDITSYINHNHIDHAVLGSLALMLAASKGYLDIVELVLKYIDVDDCDKQKLLSNAASNRNGKVLLHLLTNFKFSTDDKSWALIKAITRNKPENVKVLLDHRVNILTNNGLAIRTAVETGYIDIVTLLLENKADVHVKNDEPLLTAISHSDIPMIKLLLEHGADVNARNNKPLYRAILTGNMNVIELLLDNGANIHVQQMQDLKETERMSEEVMVAYNHVQSILDKKKKHYV